MRTRSFLGSPFSPYRRLTIFLYYEYLLPNSATPLKLKLHRYNMSSALASAPTAAATSRSPFSNKINTESFGRVRDILADSHACLSAYYSHLREIGTTWATGNSEAWTVMTEEERLTQLKSEVKKVRGALDDLFGCPTSPETDDFTAQLNNDTEHVNPNLQQNILFALQPPADVGVAKFSARLMAHELLDQMQWLRTYVGRLSARLSDDLKPFDNPDRPDSPDCDSGRTREEEAEASDAATKAAIVEGDIRGRGANVGLLLSTVIPVHEALTRFLETEAACDCGQRRANSKTSEDTASSKT